MNSTVSSDKDSSDLSSKISAGLDPLSVLILLKKNWYLFAISIVIALFLARIYISHTMPVFKTTASILVNETETRASADNAELLQGLGLSGGMQNLENQMMILKSRELTERTLKELPFEVEVFFKTFRNKLPIYPEAPIRIRIVDGTPIPTNTEFSITYIDTTSFLLTSQAEYFPLSMNCSFGEPIELNRGSLIIECRDFNWLAKNKDRNLGFIVYSSNFLVTYFSTRINVEMPSRAGTILMVSMIGTNPAKDADFLNKHLEIFQNISLERKNIEANRRIQFIDDQLVGISDSLSTTESRLQQFRSTHRVMDLSAQGQSIIGQVTLLENERARLNLEANYYDYLADYLNKEISGELPIVPITMGITDPGLTRLVDELAALQAQMSTTGAGELNPLQRNLEQRIRSTKDAVKETLNGLRRANSLARSENQEQINKANAQASALPVTERQLLGIERRFKLNDELYTYLLETRAEQQMQKASNRADSEIIDRADERYSTLVSPNHQKVRFMALLAGFGIPFLTIVLIFLFDRRLRFEDIKRLSEIPIIGYIPHKEGKVNTIVLDNPNSGIAESFRLLRSRLQFLAREAISPIILVTSSLPDDGKTFLAINLASVYSLLGKRTVLVGFDLRKPKIWQDFNIDNEHGVSTWLIGEDKLEDIIHSTSYDRLDIIPSGPNPPNPSELTALEKTHELFKLLRGKYDFIITDSSPIGLVSDTFHLATFADVFLLVVRPGKTIKDVFVRTVNEITKSGIKGTSLIINDIKATKSHYGYGEKYGYTKSHSRGRWRFLKLKKKPIN